jgi:hypothetical protein
MTSGASDSPSFARRRAIAAVHGALLGALWGLHFLLLVRATDRGWWLFDYAQADLDRFFGYERLLLPRVASQSGFWLLSDLDLLAVLACLCGATLGYLLAAIGQWLRMDPEQQSRRALLDVARSYRFVMVSLLLPLGLLVGSIYLRDWFGLVALGLAMAFVLAGSFLVWNRPWLATPGPLPLPRPAWPGWPVIRVALLLAVVAAVVDGLLDFAGKAGGAPGIAVVELPSTVFGALAALVLCANWVDRLDSRSLWAQRKALLGWRPISAFIAKDVRLGVLMMWPAAPLLACALASIWVVPQLESLLAEQGRALPMAFRLMRLRSESWWLWLLALVPLLAACNGRLYVSLFPEPLPRLPAPLPAAASLAR